MGTVGFVQRFCWKPRQIIFFHLPRLVNSDDCQAFVAKLAMPERLDAPLSMLWSACHSHFSGTLTVWTGCALPRPLALTCMWIPPDRVGRSSDLHSRAPSLNRFLKTHPRFAAGSFFLLFGMSGVLAAHYGLIEHPLLLPSGLASEGGLTSDLRRLLALQRLHGSMAG